MGRSSRAFTLIELAAVVVVLAMVVAVVLPALSSARKSALQAKLRSDRQMYEAPIGVKTTVAADVLHAQAVLAHVRSFDAKVSLTPRLSVGTADPESIYEAKLTAELLAGHPTKAGGECQVHLPLPPQIISVADLEVTVNNTPSDAVALRGEQLVWTGTLPQEPTRMSVTLSAVGKGLYSLQTPPGGILDKFHIQLTANGSDVRMLELSLQPTRLERSAGRTTYTWDYKRLLFGRPIALDVLGIAPIDRLGELSWLGPGSVILFGLLVGLVARAYRVRHFDRWMLLLVIGTFTGAYPLMYFAQEFMSLDLAIVLSAAIVMVVIAVRVVTITGASVGLLGIVLPGAVIQAAILIAATHTNLQGIILTGLAITLFVVAMALIPRLRPAEAPTPARVDSPIGSGG